MSISRPVALAALVVLLAPAVASADVISSSASYGPGGVPVTTDWNTTLTLTGFDTSLGTLTNVTVTMTGNGNFSGNVLNSPPATRTFITNVVAGNPFTVTEDVAMSAAGSLFLSTLTLDLNAQQS